MLSERSHLLQRDPVPVATRMGSFWCWTLPVETQEKAQVTADNHQKTTHKALKHMDQQPVYNGLTFSVAAAQVQQLSRQLGSCYGPRKHWAGICNPLA